MSSRAKLFKTPNGNLPHGFWPKTLGVLVNPKKILGAFFRGFKKGLFFKVLKRQNKIGPPWGGQCTKKNKNGDLQKRRFSEKGSKTSR